MSYFLSIYQKLGNGFPANPQTSARVSNTAELRRDGHGRVLSISALFFSWHFLHSSLGLREISRGLRDPFLLNT